MVKKRRSEKKTNQEVKSYKKNINDASMIFTDNLSEVDNPKISKPGAVQDKNRINRIKNYWTVNKTKIINGIIIGVVVVIITTLIVNAYRLYRWNLKENIETVLIEKNIPNLIEQGIPKIKEKVNKNFEDLEKLESKINKGFEHKFNNIIEDIRENRKDIKDLTKAVYKKGIESNLKK
jgi:predicted negative regulator of RcsB-dependent stress response